MLSRLGHASCAQSRSHSRTPVSTTNAASNVPLPCRRNGLKDAPARASCSNLPVRIRLRLRNTPLQLFETHLNVAAYDSTGEILSMTKHFANRHGRICGRAWNLKASAPKAHQESADATDDAPFGAATGSPDSLLPEPASPTSATSVPRLMESVA